MKRSFFEKKDTIALARALLGKAFVRETPATMLAGIIVETEAYTQEDPACHTSSGRTQRNAVMFEKPGLLYVYFTYGMHYCANIVAEQSGRGCAVLIRAVKPIAGVRSMARKRKKPLHSAHLTNGPGKFTQAFGLTKKHNGTDLCWKEQKIYIAETGYEPLTIIATPRIGISRAKEKLWRFVCPLPPEE